MKKMIFALVFLFLIGVVVEKAFAIEIDDPDGVDIHGFISQGYLQSDANNFFADTKNGSFDLKDMGLSFSADVSERLRAGIQIIAYEMGEFGGDDIHINWANGDYSFNEYIGMKVGKMKLNHGLYNSTRDGDFLRASILLPQSIYNEAWRSTVAGISGFEVYGSVGVGGGDAGRLTYNVQVGKVGIDLDSGVATTTKEELLEKYIQYEPVDVDTETAYTLRLLWDTPVSGLSFNTTIWSVDLSMTGTAVMPNPSVPGTYITLEDREYKTKAQSITGSVEYAYEDFLFVSEYSLNSYDFSLESVFSEKKLDTEGYYLSASYRNTDWMETGLYYSVYYANKDDKHGDTFAVDHSAWLKDACLSMRFDLQDNWVFKLEGHLMDGTAVMMNGNNPDSDKDQNWYLLGAKMTFSF